MNTCTDTPLPQVNGVALTAADETLDTETLRQRACTELLRQAAQRAGLLAHNDPAPEVGIISQAASDAIETLLERELRVPEPGEDACRRHYAAHAQRYSRGERARLRHVLFAVTPGVDVAALRRRAEQALLTLRTEPEAFAEQARALSNCPSGAQGGELGWLTREDCAPEFASEIFGKPEVGVLARLVHSRFGLHVVEVLEREAGTLPTFEEVRGSIAQTLRQQSYATAVRQYLALLAGEAELQGVELEAADTPLLQ